MSFHSFYWKNADLDDADLDRALAQLIEPTERDPYLHAFNTLLHSGNTVAEGIALDHFQYSGALSRFGGEDALDRHWPEVLGVARRLLRQPPMADSDETFEGANHASALNAMMNIAQPEDADLIADALVRAVDANVRSAACRAAGAALYGSEAPSLRLVEALGAVAFDDQLEISERTEALSNVGDADCAEATHLLVRATQSTELDLQTQAAAELTRRGRLPAHRELLERLAATWPEEAGFNASEVRRALTTFHSLYWTGAVLGSPELRRAQEELMFPSGDLQEYRAAFLSLLRSDDPAAVGIALDHFSSQDGIAEILGWDAVGAYEAEALERAREMLRQPPSPAELSPQYGEAANHLSALNTIRTIHAEPSDAELVTDLVETSNSPQVREQALWVAAGVLRKTDTPDPGLLDVIGRLVFDPALSGHEISVLRVLGETSGPAATGILRRALGSNDFDIQFEAAWQLSKPGRLEAHRQLLADTIGTWPTTLTGRTAFLAAKIRERAVG
jgi:hypothetical protein